jgi:peptidoglycan/xylan/chitin deacetylase (PgdA/CDA1 family)
MKPRERIEYSAIVDRAPLKLPDGSRIVVWPIVNIENWDIEGPMPRTVLPPPGGGNLVPDLPNWAWQEYGMRVGFWRIFEALGRHNIRATLSINGSVCEIYPRVAGAARDAGWEFMGHSYIQKPMHLLDDQLAAIRKSIDVIERFTGKKPRGWLGPGLTETFETPDLLAEAGIEYVADWVFDDQPCQLKTRHGPLYTMPYTVELNDIALMLIQYHKAVELYDRTMDQFERLYAEGEHTARIMAIAVHPYITGVPHRIGYFEKILDTLSQKPGVLFWTGDEILDWYKGAIGAADC